MRSNIAASKGHAAPWNVPLLLILTLLALQFSRASATQTLPIKHIRLAVSLPGRHLAFPSTAGSMSLSTKAALAGTVKELASKRIILG
jgi:hypothetical protein